LAWILKQTLKNTRGLELYASEFRNLVENLRTMKQFVTLALALGMVVTAFGQVATGPAISVDKDVHDYGTIKQGAEGGCVFTVTNTGTEPLLIATCKGSCGCTVPKCDTAPIAPGAKSEISVVYDTKRVGPINKSVTITSNAANEPTKVIRIKGTVEGTEAAPVGGAPVKPAATGAPANKQ
jgi:hypothetical protein